MAQTNNHDPFCPGVGEIDLNKGFVSEGTSTDSTDSLDDKPCDRTPPQKTLYVRSDTPYPHYTLGKCELKMPTPLAPFSAQKVEDRLLPQLPSSIALKGSIHEAPSSITSSIMPLNSITTKVPPYSLKGAILPPPKHDENMPKKNHESTSIIPYVPPLYGGNINQGNPLNFNVKSDYISGISAVSKPLGFLTGYASYFNIMGSSGSKMSLKE